MKAFLFDRIVKTKAKKMKEEEKMKENVVYTIHNAKEKEVEVKEIKFTEKVKRFFKKSIAKIKKVVEVSTKFMKGFVKKNWKDATLAAGSMLVAGSFSTGALSALGGGWLIYIVTKLAGDVINYKLKGIHNDTDYIIETFKYVGHSVAFTLFLFFAAPWIIYGLMNGWVYILIWVFA